MDLNSFGKKKSVWVTKKINVIQISNKSRFIWSSEQLELISHTCGKLKNVYKFDYFCPYDLVIYVCLTLPFKQYIWEAYLHTFTKYEVSMIKSVARRTVHRCHQRTTKPDSNTCWTIHDHTGPLAFLPSQLDILWKCSPLITTMSWFSPTCWFCCC